MAEWGGRKRYMPRDLDRIEVNIRRLRRGGLPRVLEVIVKFWSRKEARIVPEDVPAARAFFEGVRQKWEWQAMLAETSHA